MDGGEIRGRGEHAVGPAYDIDRETGVEDGIADLDTEGTSWTAMRSPPATAPTPTKAGTRMATNMKRPSYKELCAIPPADR